DVANTNDYAGVGPNINTVATASKIMSRQVQPSWVTYEIGYYTYNRTTNTFGKILPSGGWTMPSGENWSLVTTTVSYSDTTYFAKFFNVSSYSLSATATAVHRPRDLAIIIDLSGSMSFDSLLGGSYTGARTQSLNPESVVPTF